MKRVLILFCCIAVGCSMAGASATSDGKLPPTSTREDADAQSLWQVLSSPPSEVEAEIALWEKRYVGARARYMALPPAKAPEWRRQMIRYQEICRRVVVLKNYSGAARPGEMADLANRILEFSAHDAATRPDTSQYRRSVCLWLFEFIADDPELEGAFLEGMDAIGDGDLAKLAEGFRQLISARTKPMDIVLETVNAGQIQLGQTRQEVLLVDIWNLHCSSCIDALPEINRLAQVYRRDGLKVISVCLLEKGDDPSKVTQLMDKAGADGPLVIQRRSESPLNKQFSSFVFPTFMLIGRDGRLITTQNDKANLEGLIKKALGL